MTATAAELRPIAQQLRAALEDTYSMMDCIKALHRTNGDMHQAAESLTDGSWRAGKLISWSRPYTLHEKAKVLAKEFDLSERHCHDVVMNCGGNIDLARRKLKKEPLLTNLPEA